MESDFAGRRLWQSTVPGQLSNNNVYMLASVVLERAKHDRRDVRTQHRQRSNLQRTASDQ